MSRFKVTDLPLSGLKLIERQQVGDARGFLARLFCADELVGAGWSKPVAQINQTVTRKAGALRGLHFQRSPHAEMKLVSCLKGIVFDVAVDLRRGSPTFLQWHAEELSSDNLSALLIPEGFAHGFQALTDDCELHYVHSASYAVSYEGGINARDPRLGIVWPRAISEVSERDSLHPFIGENFEGVTL